MPWVLSAAAIVIALSAHFVVLSSPGPAPVERMAEMVLKATGGDHRAQPIQCLQSESDLLYRAPV